MNEGNQDVLNFLNNNNYLGGFSQEGIVSINKNGLEEILSISN